MAAEEAPLYKEGIYVVNWFVRDVKECHFTIDESEAMDRAVRLVLYERPFDPFGLSDPTITQIHIPRHLWDELVRLLPDR